MGAGVWGDGTSGDGASLEVGTGGGPDEQPIANRIATAIMERVVGQVEDSGMWVLIDRFIDLRIALESLYLDGMIDELMDVGRSNLEPKTDPTVTQTQVFH